MIRRLASACQEARHSRKSPDERAPAHRSSDARRRAPQPRADPRGGPRAVRQRRPRRSDGRRRASRRGGGGHRLSPLPRQGRAHGRTRARALRDLQRAPEPGAGRAARAPLRRARGRAARERRLARRGCGHALCLHERWRARVRARERRVRGVHAPGLRARRACARGGGAARGLPGAGHPDGDVRGVRRDGPSQGGLGLAALPGGRRERDELDSVSLLSAAAPVPAVLQRPHTLLEGPRIGAEGELVYSDVIAGGVFACSREGVVSEILPRRRGVGGIVPHADGGWVLSGRSLLHIAPGGVQRELFAEEDACGFNDLGSTPSGALLAGVLRYRPMAGEEPRPGRLLLLEPGGERRVLSDAGTWPNGIGVAPDGNSGYLRRHPTAARVTVAPRACGSVPVRVRSLDGAPTREFAGLPRGSADGLAVDAEGGVWVALGEGGGVARFASDGSLDEVVELPAGFVSSLSFGGPDLRDVLITTADNRVDPERGGTLLRARSEVAGTPVYPVRL